MVYTVVMVQYEKFEWCLDDIQHCTVNFNQERKDPVYMVGLVQYEQLQWYLDEFEEGRHHWYDNAHFYCSK